MTETHTHFRKFHRVWFVMLLLLLYAGPASAADRMAINVPLANIRSGPGTNYDILWKVEKYHPLKVIETKGDWYHFQDYEGDKGWIYKSLVDDIDAVIVSRDNCNIRSGPGLDNDIVFIAEQGVSFRVLERKGDWIHIRHADGDEGWIYNTLVW